jgi:enoyl-CoA hydratase/carnithine racemase
MMKKVVLQRSGGIAIVCLDNGDYNIFDADMHRQLFDALQTADSWDVGCILLCSNSLIAFSSGDFVDRRRREGTVPTTTPAGSPNTKESIEWARRTLALDIGAPVVCAISGWCLGQGFIYVCELADIRMAAPSAKFGLPEIEYGIVGGSVLAGLRQKFADGIASWIAFTGRTMDAETAERCGFVTFIVEESELAEESVALARDIARSDPAKLRAEKRALRRSASLDRLERHAFGYQVLAENRDR